MAKVGAVIGTFEGPQGILVLNSRSCNALAQTIEMLLEHIQLVTRGFHGHFFRVNLVAKFISEIDAVRGRVLESLPGLDLRIKIGAGLARLAQFSQHRDVALIGLVQGTQQPVAFLDFLPVNAELAGGLGFGGRQSIFIMGMGYFELLDQRFELFFERRLRLFRARFGVGAVRDAQEVFEVLGKLPVCRERQAHDEDCHDETVKNRRGQARSQPVPCPPRVHCV